jgi:hypothetical protein
MPLVIAGRHTEAVITHTRATVARARDLRYRCVVAGQADGMPCGLNRA